MDEDSLIMTVKRCVQNDIRQIHGFTWSVLPDRAVII